MRNFVRTIALLAALALIAYGITAGALPASPRPEGTGPPDDTVWLISLAGAFPLLLVYAWLTVSAPRTPTITITPEARFRRNVQQLGGFLLVGFALLSLHLLREQIVAAAAIKNVSFVTPDGQVVQDPRKIPELLRQRRGSIYAGDVVVAASEVITPSGYVHRIYPAPDIAYLAGYYNPTIYGSAGLEASFDRYLSGDETPNPMVGLQRTLLHRPVVGADLHLTIDPALQSVARQALGERKGGIVALDVQNGAILAMVTWPHIDPGQLSFNPAAGDWGAENKRIIDYFTAVSGDPNAPLLIRPTQGLYPPGSTFKTVSAGAALDTGIAQPTTVFTDTNGTVKVEAGNYVHRDCSTCRPRGHGPQYTLTEGYKWSLNVVFAQLGVRLGPARMWEYAQRFGFGTRYDIGIPVEASSIADSPESLNSLNLLAATAYGQGNVAATPLQMALVAATVARGGELPAPYLVSAVTEHETGRPIWQFQPHVLKRALSPAANENLRQMMITSVQSGWAKGAAIPGATVGGKTGTAETNSGDPHSWFIGFAGKDPNKAQYAIAVVVENGGEGTRVALPAARQVLVAALNRP
jgi:peptidoglycan glycosyltransferase